MKKNKFICLHNQTSNQFSMRGVMIENIYDFFSLAFDVRIYFFSMENKIILNEHRVNQRRISTFFQDYLVYAPI